MKVLLAEDSRTMMLTTSAIIKKSGHEVIKAYDGKEALSLYGSEKPDLVILDVEMPELNGFKVAKIIRSRDEDNWVPIIFLTGFVEDKHLSQGIEAGGDDYLTKPVSPLVLNAKLKAMHRIAEMQTRLRYITKELSSTNKELQMSVITDPLTGAKNRLYFDECIKREWYRAMRNKTALSLLLVDVDNFKTLNDSNGHQAGDTCLIDLVKLINSDLKRSTDILCRYGGDEFVIVLPDTSAINSMKIAEAIRKGVENYNTELAKKTEIPVNISVSIGSATCIPDDSISYSDFLSYADKALYAAKDVGRNCVIKSESCNNKSVAA
jgi:diguanylate cyclase (GGDEF)-like protein